MENSNKNYDILPSQSVVLLKELHILTTEGKLNQDSRRKLKQIFHLTNFIKPIINSILNHDKKIRIIDMGSGKSYLGFLLHDLILKNIENINYQIIGVESRSELVLNSMKLAQKMKCQNNFYFINSYISDAINHEKVSIDKIDLLTALHACDNATDDAILFALKNKINNLVLVPCCQAEVARQLKQNSSIDFLSELYKHPIHSREFGSHLTNVIRILFLESYGYSVTTTELIGFEHSMKNELIIAKYTGNKNTKSITHLNEIVKSFNLSPYLLNNYLKDTNE